MQLPQTNRSRCSGNLFHNHAVSLVTHGKTIQRHTINRLIRCYLHANEGSASTSNSPYFMTAKVIFSTYPEKASFSHLFPEFIGKGVGFVCLCSQFLGDLASCKVLNSLSKFFQFGLKRGLKVSRMLGRGTSSLNGWERCGRLEA